MWSSPWRRGTLYLLVTRTSSARGERRGGYYPPSSRRKSPRGTRRMSRGFRLTERGLKRSLPKFAMTSCPSLISISFLPLPPWSPLSFSTK
uniref:Uncharacterized protein n=1 Tax=Brassica campestris TaxID=3711 RepID=A0A3P6BNE7_BRACM|nr:unnamed protein product [Brassica rapa]